MVAQILIVASLLACLVAASSNKHARTSPSRGSIIVDTSGIYPHSYTNLSAAVSALHNKTSPQTIFILPGTYTEQVYIPPHAGPLTIQGYTSDARTYRSNLVVITSSISRLTPGLANNDATSTVRLWTSNVKLYNLNIANTYGSGSQALALSAQNTNQGFYGCNFTGYQDTVYANEGRQIYAKSYVNGAVDFIFGLRASAWFHDTDVESIGVGYITANGREATNNTSFYVFNQCKVTGRSGANSTFLGRPWRPFSRVVFQKSYLGNVVKAEGWSRWDTVQSIEDVMYGEYRNFGPGAGVGRRVNFSSNLEKPIRAEEILGNRFEREDWVDTDYLS
jgi:pectinesterase